MALVGPSGGGKTTLCNLIPRFYDVSGGRHADRRQGRPGRDPQAACASAIGMVQQEVYLFSGTRAMTISPTASPGPAGRRSIQAAKLAGRPRLHHRSCPRDTTPIVGERGVKLSGGQKQRISIARVFLKNPPILILDEATSALDNESERLVQQSLEKLAKGRTTFTIAHRLTTIRGADTIWVLTENGVEEMGSHAELMKKGGLYAHLYEMYTEKGEETA